MRIAIMIVLGLALVCALALASILTWGGWWFCGNEEMERAVSPSGRHVARMIRRDCGPNPYVTRIYVGKVNIVMDRPAIIATAPDSLKMRWREEVLDVWVWGGELNRAMAASGGVKVANAQMGH